MRPQSRSTHGKTALVLAGGGLSGAMYEIGALRAIDDILTDRSVNDFDIYVGTSAGSIVGALLANGITPEIMLSGLSGDLPGVRPIKREDLFHFNLPDILHLGVKLPKTLVGAWTNYLRYINDATLADFVWSLSEALPAGLYDSHALEKYMREILGQYGGSNDFTTLPRELHIVATDLDSGKRTVFSRESNQDVPVSLAIAASTAVPLLYKPVRIADHDYVDGSVLGNASIDIAIEHGATLVICINPLVPFDNSNHASVPFFGPDSGYLSEKGLTAVASQAGRVQSHGGLLYHIKQLRKTHPEVDIVLVEPSTNDYQMSFSNVMRYATRLAIVQHGFTTVTLYLAMRFNYYSDLLSRHGIPITARLVEEELAIIEAAENQPDVLRRILENRPTSPKQLTATTANEPLNRLNDTLNQLDVILRDWPARRARRNTPPIDQYAIDARTPARSME